MRTVILILSILILGCNNNKTNVTPDEKSIIDQGIVTYQDSIYYLLENTDRNEFEKCQLSMPFFKNFNGDTILEKSDYYKSVKIVTASETLEFNHIALDTDSDARTQYSDLGYSKTLSKHLVNVSYYEGDDFLLIDHKTAHIDTINGMPNFSPEKKRLISFYINPYNERKINDEYVDTGDVEVYQTLDDELTAIVKESFDFIPIEIRWKDENTIIIKAVNSIDYARNARTPGVTVDDLKNFIYKKIIIKEVKNKR